MHMDEHSDNSITRTVFNAQHISPSSLWVDADFDHRVAVGPRPRRGCSGLSPHSSDALTYRPRSGKKGAQWQIRKTCKPVSWRESYQSAFSVNEAPSPYDSVHYILWIGSMVYHSSIVLLQSAGGQLTLDC